MYLIIFQRLLGEALLDVLYFPLWWYSGGLKHAGVKCWQWMKIGNRTLAPGLWLGNIFVPMFGQTDWQGKIISFFMRCVQIIARAVALVVWSALSVACWLIWLLLPAAAVYGLVRSLS